jgi:hypothetical protein
MLSAFVLCEFGFGRQMSQDELSTVNMARQTTSLGGGTYKDTTAAMEILGITRKSKFERVALLEILVHWYQ